MLKCRRCDSEIEEGFDRCWNCGEPVAADLLEDIKVPLPDVAAAVRQRAALDRFSVRYEVFRGVLDTWDELFALAAARATEVGPDRLISISHSEDRNDGVVTVWYWDDGDAES